MAVACRFACAVLVTVLAAAPSLAQEPGYVDDAVGFFKPETVKTATTVIRELDKKGIRLAIESYAMIPKDSLEKFKGLDAKEKQTFFKEWAMARQKDLGANAIIVLITNDPKHLEVRVGPEAIKKGLSVAESEAIPKAMLEKLRKGAIDESLLDAVETIRKAYAGLSGSGPDGVLDEAGMFKAETIKTVNQAIAEIAKNGVHLSIETFPTVPKELIDKVKAMDAKDRAAFYTEWGMRRIKDLGPNAVHILLTREPRKLQVSLGTAAQKRFNTDDRNALIKAMVDRLARGQFDEGLLEAVETLRKRFDAPLP